MSFPALPVPDISGLPGFTGSSSATSSGTVTGGVVNFSDSANKFITPAVLGLAALGLIIFLVKK